MGGRSLPGYVPPASSALTLARARAAAPRAQLLGPRDLVGALVRADAGGLQDARQALEARLGEPHLGGLVAELAGPEHRVAVAVGAESDLGVVEVQRAEAVQADLGAAVVQDRSQAVGGAHVEARGVEVAGVQADAEAPVAAGRADQRGELGERAPERATGARGVLEVQRAAVALGQGLLDDGARALDRRADLARLRRPRVEHDALRAERVAGLQRDDQRAQRLVAQLLVLAGAVEEVDRVDEQRVDARALERRAVVGDLLVGVDAG